MLIVRRTLLLWAMMFWQGGFFFYSAVVVKVGTDVFSMFDQGLITRQVAIWLNIAGFCVLVAWVWDLLVERGACVRRRWFAWGVMLVSLVALILLHPQMDALVDVENHRLLRSADFRFLHRWYLWISTVQWLAAVVFTLWTLQNWRAVDRQSTVAG